ncbi:MAG: hypothetical protein GXO88_07760 [Chlorobi bacterium]|nr:hypothetical protein [Chlorobiota bacterium]
MPIVYNPFTGNLLPSTTAAGFQRDNFEAVDGQTVFNLNFVLKAGANVVFVNKAPMDEDTYIGTGTKVLTFLIPRKLYDKIIVIG